MSASPVVLTDGRRLIESIAVTHVSGVSDIAPRYENGVVTLHMTGDLASMRPGKSTVRDRDYWRSLSNYVARPAVMYLNRAWYRSF